MESTILSKESLIVFSDYNIHVDVPNDTDALTFLDLLESLGLEQHVTEPTHIDFSQLIENITYKNKITR